MLRKLLRLEPSVANVRTELLAVFVGGILFLVLSLTPARESVSNVIPLTLKKAVAAGAGLFIAKYALL